MQRNFSFIANSNTLEFLARVVAVIREDDAWISKRRKREVIPWATVTADRAMRYTGVLFPHDWDLAWQAISWCREVMGKREDVNDYEVNLLFSVMDDNFPHEQRALLASLIPKFYREGGSTDSIHLGSVAIRQYFDYLKLECTLPIDTVWGHGYVYRFSDSDSNVLIWSTSSKKLDTGLVYAGRCTVKAHREVHGICSTILTRCAISECGSDIVRA